MRSRRAADSMADGFEPGPFPPPGPDGGLDLPPMKAPTSPPPRLCEAGPCEHYHRLSVQVDAAQPIAGELKPGGVLSGAAGEATVHFETHHVCYPTVGVEFDLGSASVLECNRWAPVSGVSRSIQTACREEFFASDDGKAYQTALDRWRADQQAIQTTEDDAVAEAAAELAAAEAARATTDPEGTPTP